MTKKEVLKLIKTIEQLYDKPFTKKRSVFHQNDSVEKILMDTVNAWHDILHDEDSEIVFTNLAYHAKTSKFPPTIAELLRKDEQSGRYVPRDFVYDINAGEDWH